MKTICNSWYWLNGIKQCSLINTTGCHLVGNVKCGLYEPTEYAQQFPKREKIKEVAIDFLAKRDDLQKMDKLKMLMEFASELSADSGQVSGQVSGQDADVRNENHSEHNLDMVVKPDSVPEDEKKEKPHHGHKWMPAVYVTYYGILKDIAKEYGYALGIHGTITRDFDIIAVPWTESASNPLDLLRAIKEKIGINTPANNNPYDSVEEMPHGRTAYTMQTGGGGYFDISITSLKSKSDPSKEEQAMYSEDFVEWLLRGKVESIGRITEHYDSIKSAYQYWLNNIAKK